MPLKKPFRASSMKLCVVSGALIDVEFDLERPELGVEVGQRRVLRRDQRWVRIGLAGARGRARTCDTDVRRGIELAQQVDRLAAHGPVAIAERVHQRRPRRVDAVRRERFERRRAGVDGGVVLGARVGLAQDVIAAGRLRLPHERRRGRAHDRVLVRERLLEALLELGRLHGRQRVQRRRQHARIGVAPQHAQVGKDAVGVHRREYRGDLRTHRPGRIQVQPRHDREQRVRVDGPHRAQCRRAHGRPLSVTRSIATSSAPRARRAPSASSPRAARCRRAALAA